MAVREGQVLARLDDATARAALALAEAQARSGTRGGARKTKSGSTRRKLTLRPAVGAAQGRHRDAGGRRYAPRPNVRFDRRRASRRCDEQVTVAERQVELQQTDLDNTIIRAPFSGIAISKDAQPGEMVSPVSAGGGFTRTGICTIVDMRSLEIEVDVNESYINRVKPGQDVTAVLDAYPDWQIPGARDHARSRRPIARRRRCSCASASSSSTRASCRTWASRSRSSREPDDEPARRRAPRPIDARAEGRDPTRGRPDAIVVRRRRRHRRAPRRQGRRHRRRPARSHAPASRAGDRVVVVAAADARPDGDKVASRNRLET